MYTKWVIVVDDDIDARDWKDVMWAISTRMDPARDITLDREHPDRLSGLRLAGERPGLQDRAGRHQQVAAGDQARMGPQIRMDDEVIDTVTEKWPSLGLPGAGKPIWK